MNPQFNERIFMYLAYLDDSGSDAASHVALMGALLIPDTKFLNVEAMAGLVVESLVPKDKQTEFKEFHAFELYKGTGLFEGIDEPLRYTAIRKVLTLVKDMQLTFVYSALDKRWLSQTAIGGAEPLDVAFRMCALGIQQWLETNDKNALCLFMMDDTANNPLKNGYKKSFRDIRLKLLPPKWGGGGPGRPKHFLWNVHDAMYFGDSRDSIGIQLADLCGYFLARHLKQLTNTNDFFELFSSRIVCSKPEPDWSRLKGIVLNHE